VSATTTEVVGDQHDARAVVRCSSFISVRICPWMVTSSAVSARRRSGRRAARQRHGYHRRCLMPPDSSCGYSSQPQLGLGDAHTVQQLDGLGAVAAVESSRPSSVPGGCERSPERGGDPSGTARTRTHDHGEQRAHAADRRRDTREPGEGGQHRRPRCLGGGLVRSERLDDLLPIVNTGFSAVSGSWKTIAILPPRTEHSSSSDSPISSRPSKTADPATTRPFAGAAEHGQGGDGLARSRLPDDGQPSRRSRGRRDTVDGLTVPRRCGSGCAGRHCQHGVAHGLLPHRDLRRVKSVAQTVAEEVHREYRGDDHQAGAPRQHGYRTWWTLRP